MTDKTYKIKKLEWEQTTKVIFDSTCLFSKGYDFFGWEEMRMEAKSIYGRVAIWPDYVDRKNWNFYFEHFGVFATDFKSEEEAKAAAQKHHDNEIRKHLEVVSAKSVVCTRCNDAEAIAPNKLCPTCFIKAMDNKEVVG